MVIIGSNSDRLEHIVKQVVVIPDYEIVKEVMNVMGERFPDIDWYCDRCNAYLNIQLGFDDHKYIWKCTECGHKNSISTSNIYESEEEYKNRTRE